MTWYGNGNVGIGTTSPNGPLHIEATFSIANSGNFGMRKAPLVVGNGDGTSDCLLIDGNQIDQARESGVLNLNPTSSSDISLARGGGNVGIGVENASEKLHVKGDVKIEGDLEVTGSSATKFPQPDYVSAWTNSPDGASLEFTHNLGGNPDNYVVDLQFKDSGNNIHNIGYGLFWKTWNIKTVPTLSYDVDQHGAAWTHLTNNKIYVSIGVSDSYVYHVRVRIWNYGD